ncbi:aminotransferase class V-fold PLP-dependent enzyme [soil metagenome]
MSDPRSAFDVAAGTVYMDAATYGLPPRATVEAIEAALAAWASGTADWIGDWDRPAEEARADFATLVSVPEADVALLPTVSVGVGWVAQTLRPGDEVIVPADEFTSTLFPFLVSERRGVVVREVGIAELADAVGPRTTLVATSLVQMQTGLRADLAAIREATDRVGARLLLDATQALPFLVPGEELSNVDYVLAHGYKHLLCPRGATFMVVRTDRQDGLEPQSANWRAADEPYGRYFEGPLTLGPGARRFDVSLAWHSWVGARVSLQLLRQWQAAGALDEVWARARALARGAGLPGAESTLVCVPVGDPDGARTALAEAGIRASVRGSAVRLSVHVWNTDEDAQLALAALAPFMP